MLASESCHRVACTGVGPRSRRAVPKPLQLEVHHEKMIFDLYKTNGGELETTEALDREVSADVTEGGFDIDDIADEFQPEAAR